MFFSNTALRSRIRSGDVAGLRRLVKRDPKLLLARLDRDKNNPLHFACYGRQTEAIAALLECGADPRLTNRAGQSPLHIAAMMANLFACEALITKGADLNAEDNWGMRPHDSLLTGLDLCATSTLPDFVECYFSYAPKVLQLLVAHGADLHAKPRLLSSFSERLQKGTETLNNDLAYVSRGEHERFGLTEQARGRLRLMDQWRRVLRDFGTILSTAREPQTDRFD